MHYYTKSIRLNLFRGMTAVYCESSRRYIYIYNSSVGKTQFLDDKSLGSVHSVTVTFKDRPYTKINYNFFLQ
jgi:hypothetical protein